MKTKPIAKEDWNVLTEFLPPNWQELAAETGAVTRLRGFKGPDVLLRVLLLHIARGFSLRETVVLAKEAGIADISDVALMKRLRKAEGWLRAMCQSLLRERGIDVPLAGSKQISLRFVDGTVIREPGQTGSQWRIHFAMSFPSLDCDYFSLTPVTGKGSGETFSRLPIFKRDLVFGDRAYSTASGIEYLFQKDAFALVRVNTGALCLFNKDKTPFPLLQRLRSLRKPGVVGEWKAGVIGPSGHYIEGRVCAIRRSKAAIALAQKKLRKKASKRGEQLKPQTLEYAKYVIVFTTIPKNVLSAREVLLWYRLRWQIELLFKRFKSLADLGHLPKRDDASSRAWLYGKLFLALLTMKLIRCASDFSPWGYA